MPKPGKVNWAFSSQNCPSTPKRSSSLKQKHVLHESRTVTSPNGCFFSPQTSSIGPNVSTQSPSILLQSPETGGWEQEKVFCSSCFQTVITRHVCMCMLLLPHDRDRWIGSHHIYQRKQFMEACRGKAGTRLNSAFKSQPSIWAESPGSSRLQWHSNCTRSAGMQQDSALSHLQFSKIRVFFPINVLQHWREQDYCHLFLWQHQFVKH